MLSVDLTISDSGGQVGVALRGELDVVDAEPIASALAVAADRDRVIIADLARPTWQSSSMSALRWAIRHALLRLRWSPCGVCRGGV